MASFDLEDIDEDLASNVGSDLEEDFPSLALPTTSIRFLVLQEGDPVPRWQDPTPLSPIMATPNPESSLLTVEMANLKPKKWVGTKRR